MRRLSQAEGLEGASNGIFVSQWKEAALIWHICKEHSASIAVIPFATSTFSSFLAAFTTYFFIKSWLPGKVFMDTLAQVSSRFKRMPHQSQIRTWSHEKLLFATFVTNTLNQNVD